MDPLILRVDGRDVTVTSDLATPLLYVLRNELGLTGPKLGCGLEQCGSCAVLVDGQSTLSCNAPVGQFVGKTICTVQAKDEPVIAAVKNAFVQAGAAQCGYCIPGMVIALSGLFKKNPRPREREIRDALQPHLCRCGTHTRILQAARALAAGNLPP
jgi:nicotinate dehydrogenase subunit A